MSLTVMVSGAAAQEPAPPTQVSAHGLLDESRVSTGERVFFREPTHREKQHIRAVMPAFVARVISGDVRGVQNLEPQFLKAGLRLQVIETFGETWVVLFEGGNTFRGTGTYVFRLGEASEWVIQAPHTFHDVDTGELANTVFQRSKARAFFFNSMHRYRAFPEEKKSDAWHAADVAHTTKSFFYLINAEWLKASPSTVLQVHGFRRRGGAPTNIIVSNGTQSPGESVRALSGALNSVTDVAVYPVDTREKGATTNTIGRWIRHSGAGQFLHLELAFNLRTYTTERVYLARALVRHIDGVEDAPAFVQTGRPSVERACAGLKCDPAKLPEHVAVVGAP